MSKQEAFTREEFVTTCLNAAVNLYGILTCEEFLNIYNGYAKAHDDPVSKELDANELVAIAEKAIAAVRDADDDPASTCCEDVWFDLWTDPDTGVGYILYYGILDEIDAENNGESNKIAARRVTDRIARWKTKELKVLPEDEFMAYTDPSFGEETPNIHALAEFLGGDPDGDSQDPAELDAFTIQGNLRVNGPNLRKALDELHRIGFVPADKDEYLDLVKLLLKLIPETRAWDYRGHTQNELVDSGDIAALPPDPIPAFATYLEEDNEYEDGENDEDDGYGGERDGDYDDYGEEGDEGDYIDLDALPSAEPSPEPVDFRFVKDPEKREKVLQDYLDIRSITRDFVLEFVMKELTQEERKAAKKRLGFDEADFSPRLGVNLDMVAGDFASMMDDQSGEAPIKRVLAKIDELPYWAQKASEYYRNYRYTWLQVLAVKSGLGLKCRDLLTGDELFLMETSYSLNPAAKGTTVCCGISPMGQVHLTVGVIHPANFDNPEVILKIVLSHLGIPADKPIRLSFSDQARFAAETIRRLNAVDKFSSISYG